MTTDGPREVRWKQVVLSWGFRRIKYVICCKVKQTVRVCRCVCACVWIFARMCAWRRVPEVHSSAEAWLSTPLWLWHNLQACGNNVETCRQQSGGWEHQWVRKEWEWLRASGGWRLPGGQPFRLRFDFKARFFFFFLSNDNDREKREEQLRFNVMDLAGEHKKR